MIDDVADSNDLRIHCVSLAFDDFDNPPPVFFAVSGDPLSRIWENGAEHLPTSMAPQISEGGVTCSARKKGTPFIAINMLTDYLRGKQGVSKRQRGPS